LPDVTPRLTSRFTPQDPTRASCDLGSPRDLDFVGLVGRIVQASEEFCREIRPLAIGKR
jgi:hypothetical protein